jgi:hypothetical protein
LTSGCGGQVLSTCPCFRCSSKLERSHSMSRVGRLLAMMALCASPCFLSAGPAAAASSSASGTSGAHGTQRGPARPVESHAPGAPGIALGRSKMGSEPPSAQHTHNGQGIGVQGINGHGVNGPPKGPGLGPQQRKGAARGIASPPASGYPGVQMPGLGRTNPLGAGPGVRRSGEINGHTMGARGLAAPKM